MVFPVEIKMGRMKLVESMIGATRGGLRRGFSTAKPVLRDSGSDCAFGSALCEIGRPWDGVLCSDPLVLDGCKSFHKKLRELRKMKREGCVCERVVVTFDDCRNTQGVREPPHPPRSNS